VGHKKVPGLPPGLQEPLEHVPSALGFNGLAFAAGTIVDGLGLSKPQSDLIDGSDS
jgi:hypothetical protein